MNTVRLKPHLAERIRRVAMKKGITVSEAHREALEAYCASALEEQDVSRYDDVIGIIEGPADLAESVSSRYAQAMAEKHAGPPAPNLGGDRPPVTHRRGAAGG
jgi:hypothetical protein